MPTLRAGLWKVQKAYSFELIRQCKEDPNLKIKYLRIFILGLNFFWVTLEKRKNIFLKKIDEIDFYQMWMHKSKFWDTCSVGSSIMSILLFISCKSVHNWLRKAARNVIRGRFSKKICFRNMQKCIHWQETYLLFPTWICTIVHEW